MNLFKKPKYLLMILLASFTFVTFVPQFTLAQSAAETRVQVNQATGNTGDGVPGIGAAADATRDWLADKLGLIVWWFTIRLPSIVLLKEIQLFTRVGTYNNFTTQPQVQDAWGTIRDLANMFFILILLLMAFGTILQVQGYGYRQMLSKLLLMAILVNFSKSIVALLIDFSQIVTLTFLAPVIYSLSGNIVVSLGLQNIMKLRESKQLNNDVSTDQYTSTSYLMAMILGGIMMIITTVIFGVILIMFVMRVIGLWIMVILSPLAFLARAFPKMNYLYNQWEGELSKNLTLGPALAFFMWLAFSIVGQGNISTQFNSPDGVNSETYGSEYDPDQSFTTNVSQAVTQSNMLNFVIAISLLMAGLKFAADSKVAGASVARGASNNLQRWGSRIGRGATIGAAAGAGALALRGTSGEGGLRGVAGQARGLAGQTTSRVGAALHVGGMERFGMRQVAQENARRQRKERYVARGAEGMTPEQAEQYYRSYGNVPFMPGSREGQNLLHKTRLRRGLATADIDPATMTEAQRLQVYNKRNAEDISQEEVNQMKAQRYREMEQSFTRSGDNESLQTLRRRSGLAHNAESIREQISEQGHKSLSSIDFSGIVQHDVGALQSLLELSEKELTEVLDAMNDQRRDSLMRELEEYKHQLVGQNGANFGDRNSALGKVQLLQGKFANNRTGMVDRVATTDRNGNAIGAATHSVVADYQALRNGTMAINNAAGAPLAAADQNVQAERFMTSYLQSATGGQMARINRDEAHGNTRFYDDVTGRASDTQFTEILRAPATVHAAPAPYVPGGPNVSRREMIARNRTLNGNVESVLNNSQTMHFVSDADVLSYIATQRGAGRSDVQIANQIPSHAHLVFANPDHFATYILGLNKGQLGKLDGPQLRAMKVHPFIVADPAKLAMINDVV